MPDDLNFNIPIGFTDQSDIGLSKVDQRVTKTRRNIEAPIKAPPVNYDVGGLDYVDKRIADLQVRAAKPIEMRVRRRAVSDAASDFLSRRRRGGRTGALPDVPDYTKPDVNDARDRAIADDREARRAAQVNVGIIPRAAQSFPPIPLRDDPIGLKSPAPDRSDYEQQVRQAEAGIVRGMKKRADAEARLAGQATAELEARARLGLGSTLGRDVATKDLQLGDVAGPAARPRFADDEQRIRAAQARLIRAMDADAKAFNVSAAAAKAEAEARSRLGLRAPRTSVDDPDRLALRRREENVRTGNVDPLTAAEGNYSTAAYARITAEQSRERNRLLNAPQRPDGLLGRLLGGTAGRSEVGGGSGRGPTVLGGALQLENRVSLGGGNKLVGDLALPAAGIAAVVAALGELGTQAKAFRDHLAQGVGASDAAVLGLRDLGAKLPLIGGVLDGLDSLAAELNGDAAKARARAKNDQIAADNQKVSDYRVAADERGRQINDPLSDAIARARTTLQISDANNFDPTGRAGSRIQATSDYADTTTQLDRQEAELRRNQNSNDDSKRLIPDDFDKAIASIGTQRQEASDALGAKIKDTNTVANKANSDRLFALQQEALQAQGRSIDASIQQIDRDAHTAIAAAQARVDQANEKYGKGSEQANAANKTLTDAIDDANGKTKYVIPGLESEQDDEDRRRQTDNAANIHGYQEEDLRQRAERTGDRGIGLQADAMSVVDQYRREADDIRAKLDDPKAQLQDGDRKQLQDVLDNLPNRLDASINDLTRAKVTPQDFVNGATAQAVDASGLTGLAQGAREDAQAQIAKSSSDTSTILKTIADAIIPYLRNAGNSAPALAQISYP